MSDQTTYDDDYARLIHVGISNYSVDYKRYVYPVPVPEEERARWEAEVAKPWWQAMRERAKQDGLRIECYLGGDATLGTIGLEPLIAAAALVSPGGSRYGEGWGAILSEEMMEARLRDWGDTLTAARERHPLDEGSN